MNQTVNVVYVGTKEIKHDNVADTGVVWRGNGDVQPVPLLAWAKLAKHTGVWALQDVEPAPPAGGSKTLEAAVTPPPPAPAPAPAALGTPAVPKPGASKGKAVAKDAPPPAPAPAPAADTSEPKA